MRATEAICSGSKSSLRQGRPHRNTAVAERQVYPSGTRATHGAAMVAAAQPLVIDHAGSPRRCAEPIPATLRATLVARAPGRGTETMRGSAPVWETARARAGQDRDCAERGVDQQPAGACG